MSNRLKELAAQLVAAENNQHGIQALTESYHDLSIKEAYLIQLENIEKKIQVGQRIVGKKIGLTSLAMQQLLHVNEPDYGHLLDSMVVENGNSISTKKLIQPKVEGEIAFILNKELKGPNVTAVDVLQATSYVVPALEVVDSRIQDWQITLADTVADNASSGMYVLGGKPVKVDEIDLELIGMVLFKNGEIVNTGVGAAALGHPANCVAWLANKLAEFNISLKPNEVILSGALSAAVAVEAGDCVTAKFAHVGEVRINFC